MFKITGIGGQDILDGNKTLTLGLVWQIMRAYTLSILQKLARATTPIADKDIINWANEKVERYLIAAISFNSPRKKTLVFLAESEQQKNVPQ